ncbi:SH3 domain-containing protein [Nodosilinea sp. E11]|uniref:SH3 domain-containing protein n=1 Tax=Nodosilinea sp. E11 TaxID=3037479 RepID=UPI002934C07F|nr:SH3 domain-containing protein [Nodosilinea sp. E11]WOD41561.1 SH3 domain-containing protein [Nodosilinea sp. E11]
MQLPAGTYATTGSLYTNSYRVIFRQGDRTGILLVNGPASPYAGYENNLVSSLSFKDGSASIDATQQVLLINPSPDEVFEPGRTHFALADQPEVVWEQINDTVELSDVMSACLASIDSFSKVLQGRFIQGLAMLKAENTASRINVRSGPGLNYTAQHYGLVGDEVTCLAAAPGEDSSDQLWYQVKFDQGQYSSEAEGWIRGDLIDWL